MKFTVLILILGAGLFFPPEATAFTKGGCVVPRPPRPPGEPTREAPRRPLPVIHEVRGVRTAGHGTHRLRAFPLNATGFLCGKNNQEAARGNRPSRSRVAVSLTDGGADWDHRVQITVSRTADFRLIFRSGNPSSFDSFAFFGVEPGTYVFTLDSLGDWWDPIDIEVEYHGRIIGHRTAYPAAMEHPALDEESGDPKKRVPRETLFSYRD